MSKYSIDSSLKPPCTQTYTDKKIFKYLKDFMINTPRKAQGIKFHAFYQNYLIIIKEYACMCNHILPVSTSPLTTLKNYSGAAAVPGEEYVSELYQQLNSVYMQTILSDHGRWKNDSTRTDLRAELRGP